MARKDTWKKGTYVRRSDGLRLTDLFTVDRPMAVVEVSGLGNGGGNISFADQSGKMLWHLGLNVPADVEELPLARDRGASNCPADPERAEIGIVLDVATMRRMIAEMMSVMNEYERTFPVKSRGTRRDSWRSR